MLSYWFWFGFYDEREELVVHIYKYYYELQTRYSEQIMGSIRRHKNAMSALLAEFYDRPNNNLEFGDEFDDFSLSKKR